MKKYFGLRGHSLNWAVGLIAGCDFLLFGYGKELFPSNCYLFVNLDHSSYIHSLLRPGCHGWHFDNAQLLGPVPRD